MGPLQFFPLSSLIEILNIDGKDKILPVIQANENYQQQMEQMAQQVQQMGEQMEQMAQENQSLKQNVAKMGDAFNTVSARLGQAPNQEPQSAMVNSAENNFGQQTGMPLPT